jgi:hypothetical protein
MKNAKWYLQCDLDAKVAVDLIQLPDTWRNIASLCDLSDESLANLAWSQNHGVGFMTVDTAVQFGISQASIDAIVTMCTPTVDDWVRSMRNPLLEATDAVTTSDRWASYDVVSQRRISSFRQALRDIPQQNSLYTIAWPAIPAELDFLRAIDVESVTRITDEFVAMMQAPAIAYTKKEKQDDQWLRIHDERERRKAGGVQLTVGTKSYWFWTDAASRNQYALLDGSLTRKGIPPTTVFTSWKTMSGEFVPFTQNLLHQIIDAGVDKESELFVIAEQHRQAMMAATDPDSYDYSGGWPQTYQEFVAN